MLSNLENQLDEMFQKRTEEKWQDQEPKDQENEDVNEKAKVIDGVRQHYVSMTTDIKDLLKNEWSTMITDLESQKSKAEASRRERLAGASDEQTKIVEKEHRLKMEELNQQVGKLEREK